MKKLLLTITLCFLSFGYFQQSTVLAQIIPNPDCLSLDGVLTSIAWSPDNQFIALGGQTGVHIYTNTLEYVYSYQTNNDNFVYSFEWNVDSSKLATLYSDGDVYIWDMINKDEYVMIDSELSNVAMLDWSPDNTKLAMSSRLGQLSLYNILTDNLVILGANNEYQTIDSISWNTDSNLLSFNTGESIIIWDTEINEEFAKLRTGYDFIVNWDDNSLLFSGRLSNGINNIDFPSYFVVYNWNIEPHNIEIIVANTYQSSSYLTRFYSFVIHPNKNIVSGYAFNDKIYIWKLDDKNFSLEIDGLVRGEWVGMPAYNSLAWSPDGQFIGNVGPSGQACIWDMSSLE